MTLYIGNSISINVPGYWAASAEKPQHFWPFSQTGDYTDRGSIGGLDLTAGGTGNSFTANGLVLNGSGYAICPTTSADINDLGSTFSLLFDIYEYTNTADTIFISSYDNPTCHFVIVTGNDNCTFYIYSGSWKSVISSASSIPHATRNQVIVTYIGGLLTFYVNGSFVNSGALDALTNTETEKFSVGSDADGGQKITGTFRSVGILKGTAWSVDDVAVIYAGLS